MQVRVVDFGIAKLADDDDTLGQLTQDGRVPHSPAYASPEQLRGLSHLTPASDVFSLGAVGYQLITGERPFTDGDRNRMQLGMGVEPKPPREVNPAVPGSINALILRALSVDPLRRFRDADELATELERAMRMLSDQPVEPYLAGAAIVTAAGDASAESSAGMVLAEDDDDDRTQLVFDDDDRTLVSPPLPPPPLPPVPKREAVAQPTENRPSAPAPLPPRKAEKNRVPSPDRRKKRGFGGIFVWTFVLLTLLVAGMWLFNELMGPGRGPSLADQLRDPVVVPDELETEAPIDVVVRSDEERARDLDERGRVAFEEGRFDDAFDYQQQAVRLDPGVWAYHRNFGLTLLAIGDADGAAREFERAIGVDGARAEAYINLHQSQLALGDTLDAIRSLEAYIAREVRLVPRANAASRLAELQASQNPDAPPLLGEEVDSDPIGAGPSAPPSVPPSTTTPSPRPGQSTPGQGQAVPVPAPNGGAGGQPGATTPPGR